MSDKAATLPRDSRSVIEKGFYRPMTAGPEKPPATRPGFAQDGYRPATSGPSKPPATKPPAATPASGEPAPAGKHGPKGS